MTFSKTIHKILFVAALLLVREMSYAQCTGSTTIFSENFGINGDGTNCFSTTPAAGISPTLTFIPGPTNGNNPPSDGQYSIWCNRVYGWFNWHDPFSDATTDPLGVNGNMAIINGVNNEFYRKTLTVCPAQTYTVYFKLTNLVDSDIGSCGPPFDPNITASAFNVGTTTGSTTNIGTIAMTSTITWNTYSFSFTTGAAQTSIDVVLGNLNGGGCGNDFAFDDFSVVGPSTVLPVSLLSFTAENISENLVRLKWQTTEERINDYFIIEQSSDGIHFIPVGTLDGHGTTTGLNTYSFLDTTTGGTIYYRLKQVDENGSYQYSKIISTETTQQDILIYPNPGNGVFQIELGSPDLTEEISILTMEGTIVRKISGGLIQNHLKIEELSKGMYFLHFTSKNNHVVQKVIIH